jgi:YegS/Rv2252/BmrU family lipid kinase
MRKAALIANPTAGQGGAGRRDEELTRFCSLLKAGGVDVDVLHTAAPGDAGRLAAESAQRGIREIIVAGGDGTVNEVLQGLVGTGACLALWPRGTGNVLGRELSLPAQLERLADIILAGKVMRARIGCAVTENTGEQRYFLLMAGIGLDAAIAQRVRPALKRRLGQAAFWYSGLEEFVRWQPNRFQVEVDGVEYPATFAAIGKSPHYGGSLAITPRARLDSPEFEVCLINSVSRLRYLQLLPYAMFGGVPEGLKDVTFLRAAAVRARGENVHVQVDGEVVGQLPMSFSMTPHVIEIVVR